MGKGKVDHRKVTAEILALGGRTFGMDLVTPWLEFGGATCSDAEVVFRHLAKTFPNRKRNTKKRK